MKRSKKMKRRLDSRQRDFDNSVKSKPGYRRPGSNHKG